MIKEKYSLEVLAISLGRALQSGTLLFINLLYMVYADPKLYVSLGIALAWSGPLSLLVMFGGYISASQLKNKSYQNEEEILQSLLIYRPLIFLCGMLLLALAIPGTDDSTLSFVLIYTCFLVLAGMSDVFLFRKQLFFFMLLNFVNVVLVSSISLLILLSFSNWITITFLPLIAALVVISILIRSGAVTMVGFQFFMNKLGYFLYKTISANFVVLLSSVSLGFFLAVDRLMLPYLIEELSYATYLAALTLSLPINLISVIYGKYTVLKNFHSDSGGVSKKPLQLRRFGFTVLLALGLLPLQSIILSSWTAYEFSLPLQVGLNMAGVLIILSKDNLAKLYAHEGQLIVSVSNILLICVTVPILIFVAENLVAIGAAKFSLSLIYLFILAFLLANKKSLARRY